MRALLICLLLPAAAIAEPYVFIGAGRADARGEVTEPAGMTRATESGGDVGPVIGFGYRLLPYLALEAAAMDLGQVHQHLADFTSGPNSGRRNQQVSGEAYQAALIGSLPFRRFALHAKLGTTRVKSESRIATSVFAPDGSLVSFSDERSSASETMSTFGIGASLALPPFEIRAMQERWGSDFDRFSLDFAYRF